MKSLRLFRGALFGISVLFGLMAVLTSALCIHTVDKQLSNEYRENNIAIATSIANAAEDIILTRDLSVLQSLLEQFRKISGVEYIYVADENGKIIAHTFIPGIPEEILALDNNIVGSSRRSIPEFGNFIESSRPILMGRSGTVHVGMEESLIAFKIQTAVGRQVYLVSILFVFSIMISFALLSRAARPLVQLANYARGISELRDQTEPDRQELALLTSRLDEVGEIARLLSRYPTGTHPEPHK